jgi:type VI secretion system protein ImpG
MLDPLYLRYEEELAFIRHQVRDFALRYPSAASRLLLENDSSADPHIERLIESFALLAARVRTKTDDEIPKMVEGFVERLYPHFVRPLPTMCILGFEVDPKRARIPAGLTINSGTMLASPAPDQDRILFKTGKTSQIWPIRTIAAEYHTSPVPQRWAVQSSFQAAIHIRIELYGGLRWSDLQGISSLNFYLRGSREPVEILLDTILNHSTTCHWIVPESGSEHPSPIRMEKPIKLVGLEPDEALIPGFQLDLQPYRLLTEYMNFADKFHFIDVPFPEKSELSRADRTLDLFIGLKNSQELLEKTVTTETFVLGCIPAINLFEQTAEPIPTVASKYEYLVVPDVAHSDSREVYEVQSVTRASLQEGRSEELQPFFTAVWEQPGEHPEGFWQSVRTFPRSESRSLSDTLVRIVTPGLEPKSPDGSTLVIRTTCSNGDLPLQLAQVKGGLSFSLLSGSEPLSRIVTVSRPTPSIRPPSIRQLYGRLLSQVNLNWLSWTDSPEGAEAFRNILKLYLPSDPAVNREVRLLNESRINAIEKLETRSTMFRFSEQGQSTWIRGLELNLYIRTEDFVQGGLIPWGSVIERFLGMHLSLNSSFQMKLLDFRGQSLIHQWPIRTGEIPCL